MDWIRSLQDAIDYMEDNILEKINYEDAAKHVYMSSYNFHRYFSMITGFTPNEYIRNRRLSMAGQEIAISNNKVIEVAMKYGYESVESFTKAFVRFHGVTPNVVKHHGGNLKSFNRLIIKVKLEGGTLMDYRIEKKASFNVLAKVEKFNNEVAGDRNDQEIPGFWTMCLNDDTFEVLNRYCGDKDTYGICAPLSKESQYFEYGIGKEYDGEEIPEGFKLWEVKPTIWAVFKCHGEDGKFLIK